MDKIKHSLHVPWKKNFQINSVKLILYKRSGDSSILSDMYAPKIIQYLIVNRSFYKTVCYDT